MTKFLDNKFTWINILFIGISLLLLIETAWLAIQLQQKSCWDKWQTEAQAIQHCENHTNK
jgi:hypothetical protein